MFVNTRWLLLLIACVCSDLLHSQEVNFEQTVSFIQQKVQCCSVPFSASKPRKVDSISIERNGTITLYYPCNNPPQTINIFELHLDGENKGIDVIMSGQYISFNINEENSRLIRMRNADEAGQVYEALMYLYKICRKEEKMFHDLDFEQTVDVINMRLAKWAVDESITLSAVQNGDVMLTNKLNQSFRFNLFELEKEDKGIEIEHCDERKHAPSAWMHFRSRFHTVAFIRLKCHMPPAELNIMQQAFLHLKSLCKQL